MADQSDIKITKVKWKESDGKIHVAYTQKHGEFTDVRTSQSDEGAAPEFYDAIKGLRVHAGGILGFTKEQTDKLTPHSVHYTYDSEGGMGAIISLIYETPSGRMTNINTPIFKCPKEEMDEANPGFLSEEAAKALWEVELQAKKYLNGERAQIVLFGEAEAGTADSESDAENEEFDDEEGDDFFSDDGENDTDDDIAPVEAGNEPVTNENDEAGGIPIATETDAHSASVAPIGCVIGFPRRSRQAATVAAIV